ncbi:hypothetical protein [Luteitalea sp.]|uniref:hypothetical protein n=1 Tax=Luteitalea sp. TaxID=2004800 RepID=UPI0037C68228
MLRSLNERTPLPRRAFLGAGVRLACCAAGAGRLAAAGTHQTQAIAPGGAVADNSGIAFLDSLARATIDAARVAPGASRDRQGPNTTGISLITPGGRYPALWVRDFAMSLDCGLIPAADILAHLRLILRCQHEPQERRLASGGIVPAFAIPDHITLSGGAVFFPGTYSSGEDQGAPPWGPLPPIDDHFFIVHIAHALWRATGDTAFLAEEVGGRSVLERLRLAFASPASDPVTGASITEPGRRAVGFGFHDTVRLEGALAFATLLRHRAAQQLEQLCRAAGRDVVAREYANTAQTIAASIVPVFGDPRRQDGWLRAATRVGRQPDVWATLFALHLGVLPAQEARRARRTIAAAVRAPGHTIEYEGAVRHVPSDRFFRPDQCWEAGGSRVHTYQSGAFWHTPTGWLLEAIHEEDRALARQVWARAVAHLRRHDFRQGPGHGAPWECFGRDMADAQNPVYMTSVTLPLAIVRRLTIAP